MLLDEDSPARALENIEQYGDEFFTLNANSEQRAHFAAHRRCRLVGTSHHIIFAVRQLRMSLRFWCRPNMLDLRRVLDIHCRGI
jgi:hypothetical protein